MKPLRPPDGVANANLSKVCELNLGSTRHRAAWQPNWINTTSQGSQCRATAHAEAKAALMKGLSRGCNPQGSYAENVRYRWSWQGKQGSQWES